MQPFRVPAPRLSSAERAEQALRLSGRLSLAVWANGALISAVLGSALGAEAGLTLVGAAVSSLLLYVDRRAAREPLFRLVAALTVPLWTVGLAIASHASIIASAVAGCVFGGLLGAFGIPLLALRTVFVAGVRTGSLALHCARALLALLI